MMEIIRSLQGHAPAVLAVLVNMEIQLVVLMMLVLAIERMVTLSPRARHSLWLIVLAKAFLPPVLPWPAGSMPLRGYASFADAGQLIAASTEAHTGANVATWLLGAWVASSLALATIAIARGRRCRRQLGSARPFELPRDPVYAASAHRWPPILASRAIASPLSMGLVRPRIYIPFAMTAGDAMELRSVLFHELAHARAKDGWLVLLQTIAQIAHPFPHVWFMNHHLTRYRETLRDAFALDHARVAPREYGRVLLRFLEMPSARGFMSGGMACFVESGRSIEERLRLILAHEEGRLARLSGGQKVLVAGLVMALLPLTLQCRSATDRSSEPAGIEASVSASPDSGGATGYEVEPVPLRQVSPSYPADARSRHLEGTVVVKVLVGVDGKVKRSEISSCTTTGAGFEDAALHAVEQWEFTPARKGGLPVLVWIAIPFRFALGD